MNHLERLQHERDQHRKKSLEHFTNLYGPFDHLQWPLVCQIYDEIVSEIGDKILYVPEKDNARRMAGSFIQSQLLKILKVSEGARQ